jgi:hypothetical protein
VGCVVRVQRHDDQCSAGQRRRLGALPAVGLPPDLV